MFKYYWRDKLQNMTIDIEMNIQGGIQKHHEIFLGKRKHHEEQTAMMPSINGD